MSGTAPNDPSPGGHAGDRGLEQTRLDGNQHGQAQNLIDETKDTHGTTVDRDVGAAIDATKSTDPAAGGLSSKVDDILSKTSAVAGGSGGGGGGGGSKATAATERGFRVGEEADLHGLASSKQP
ncbi:hypothetical protein CkaCkLH20_11000 [Colletotrichum karsti]|uniref:Uncharacterized protein n=1 Tax=Colletotrichum karsti TaxID=1095194 RepID=A0A9P6LDF3_9PEZI|nr:uncharacterized protein CkaCkLH20_11000 [Colletotrichum karsti]KAF9871589.1 hypothetical protein CkaCkLH20_11000 [Colletotrichum karsti]